MTLLLEASELTRTFPARQKGGTPVLAVDSVSLALHRGEVVGLVGESGSGKSTLGKLLVRVLEADSGTTCFDGVDLRALDSQELRRIRGRIQLIYQGATASLNPGLTVGQHLGETVKLHRPADARRVAEVIEQTLDAYGLAGKNNHLPAELSGGERRRVGIARALLPEPDLVVADEPTAGLDASVKAEVLDLMLAARRSDMTYLFISHELDLVRYVSDRVLVMHQGKVVQEMSPSELDPTRIGEVELHPYTERLLAASFGAP